MYTDKIFSYARNNEEKGNYERALKLYIEAEKNCNEDLKKDVYMRIANCYYHISDYINCIRMYLSALEYGMDKNSITEIILKYFYDYNKQKQIYEENIKLLSEYNLVYNKNFTPFDCLSNIIIYSDINDVVIYDMKSNEILIKKCMNIDLSGNKDIPFLIYDCLSLPLLIDLESATYVKSAYQNVRTPLYFCYSNINIWGAALTYSNVKELLIRERVVFLSEEKEIASFFKDRYTISPVYAFGENVQNIADTLQSITKEREESTKQSLLDTEKYYKDNADSITENIRLDKAKILFITTRHSTALQYHVRNCCNACLSMGYDARIDIEPSGISQSDALFSIYEFKPDIVFMIDHFRFELPFVPEEVFFVTWIQDDLPHIMSKETPAKLTDRDFVLNGFTTWNKFLSLGYPAERMIDAPVFFNDYSLYKHYDLTDDEYEKYGCDITMVCHASNSKAPFLKLVDDYICIADLSDELQAQFRNAMTEIYNSCNKLLYENKMPHSTQQMVEFFDDIFRKHGLTFPSYAALESFVQNYQHRVNAPAYRETLTVWIIEADYTNVKLWGNGWLLSDNPDIKKYAMGPAKNGETLSKIYNASKLTIGNNKFITGTTRVGEAIMSNCFYLCNYIPEEYDYVVLSEWLGDDEIVYFKSKEELLSKLELYLNNENERNRIIKNGQKKIKEQFKMEKLMEKMMKKTKECCRK